MSSQIYITFAKLDGRDPYEFRWNVRSTSLAERWLGEMASAMKSKRLREQRFNGWAATESDQRLRVQALNESIATINRFYKERYYIPEQAQPEMSQEDLNALHHHFELLMGQSWNRSELTRNIPEKVHVAVRLLNDLVHDYESADRVARALHEGRRVERSFHFQLVPYRQRALTAEDLKTFTFSHELGDLVSNYCQLGKTWVEVFNDKDMHIHPENIAPLRHYASTFCCYFYTLPAEEASDLAQSVKQFILEKGRAMSIDLDPEDAKHALGHAVFANLDSASPLLRWSDYERTQFMQEHPNISAIRLVSGGQEIRRTFPDPYSYCGRVDSGSEYIDSRRFFKPLNKQRLKEWLHQFRLSL